LASGSIGADAVFSGGLHGPQAATGIQVDGGVGVGTPEAHIFFTKTYGFTFGPGEKKSK
jgi:hypothetical protein